VVFILAGILGGGTGLSEALSSSVSSDRERARCGSDIGVLQGRLGKRCCVGRARRGM
jgi:hypothetical protein